MIDFGTFKDDIKHIEKSISDKPSYSIELTVTSSCNFRCSYCCEGDSCTVDTTYEDMSGLFKMIDGLLVDDWFLSTYGSINFGFWGGEPTLRPDIIKQVVNRYKDNHLITFFIYTNGYKCDTLVDLFGEIKDKITIQVSYDGGEINKNRLLTGGQETSSIVRDTIYRLIREGYTVHLKSTMTYYDFDKIESAWDDIKLIHDDLGKHIKFAPTVDYTKEYGMDMDVVRRNFVKIAKKELGFYKEHGYHLFSWFDGQVKKCTFMKYGLCVDTNGDLLYCHGCSYSRNKDELVFGNIKDGLVVDKIRHNYELFNTPDDTGCFGCISNMCMTCNVQKHLNSKKDTFLERWYDLTCQTEQCDMFREFSKVRIALEEVKRR